MIKSLSSLPSPHSPGWLLLLGIIIVFVIIEAQVQAPYEAAGESFPDPEWTELGVYPHVC